MQSPFRIRILKFLTGLMAALAVVSSISNAFKVSNLEFTPGIEEYQSRILQIKSFIPDSTRTVGYVSDLNGDAEYYLAQYALTPVILKRSADKPIVIGNFSNFDHAYKTAKELDLTLIKDFGHGLICFSHERK